MPIDYQIPGVNPRFVHPYEGVDGPFFVAEDGANKEAVYGFIYGDEFIRLKFFAEIDIARTDGRPVETITVHEMSGDLRKWDTFLGRRNVIKQNIDRFFRARTFYSLDVKRVPENEPITINFLG